MPAQAASAGPAALPLHIGFRGDDLTRWRRKNRVEKGHIYIYLQEKQIHWFQFNVEFGVSIYCIDTPISTLQALAKVQGKTEEGIGYDKEPPVRSSFLFDEYGVENSKIELIKNHPCNSKKERIFWIKETDCVNRFLSGRTGIECAEMYRMANPEKLRYRNTHSCFTNPERV